MSGEIDKAAAALGVPKEKLQEHQLRMTANALASAEALPGPVRDAFSPCPVIMVGEYSVHPCYDGHIEYLSLLEHPLNQMRLEAQMNPESEVQNQYQPTGPAAWQLCYLFTHTLDEIDDLVEKGGLDALKRAAKRQFSRLQMGALIKLSEAAIQQYGLYWAPVLSYGPAESGDDDHEPKKKPEG